MCALVTGFQTLALPIFIEAAPGRALAIDDDIHAERIDPRRRERNVEAIRLEVVKAAGDAGIGQALERALHRVAVLDTVKRDHVCLREKRGELTHNAGRGWRRRNAEAIRCNADRTSSRTEERSVGKEYVSTFRFRL